jgi:hypothetical protein
MKTPFAQAFAAAVLSSTPLISIAQNIVSQPGIVDRSIERLTLLPGPNLLSPPRTTPTMMPSPMKLDVPPSFHFEPAVPRFVSGGQGTLRLVDRTPSSPLTTGGNVKEQPRPSPESLRFDSTLETPASAEMMRFKFIPKRD